MLKLFLAAVVASLGAGCATHADISNLQSQIDGLKVTAIQLSSDIASAKNTAAGVKYAAQQVTKASDELNLRLNRSFCCVCTK